MTVEKKPKEIKVTVVSHEEFTDYEFQPPSSFFIMDSLQNYNFYHTRSRAAAQDKVDEDYGKGRYKVIASKLEKGSGEYTCRGTQTR